MADASGSWCWNEQNRTILIDFFRDNEILWNTKHINYKNKRLKNGLVKQLRTLLGSGISEVEIVKKWRNLRTQFGKEMSKVKTSIISGTSSEEVYIPQWAPFESLKFLLDGDDHRSTLNQFHESEDIEIDDAEEEDQPSPSQLVLAMLSAQESTYAHAQMTSVHPTKRYRTSTSPSLYSSSTQTSSDSFCTAPVAPGIKREDSYSAFGSFIAEELREIEDKDVVNELKFNFHHLLYAAKFGKKLRLVGDWES